MSMRNPAPGMLLPFCRDRLEQARGLLDSLLAVTDSRTVENTLEPLQEIDILLDEAHHLAGLMVNLHPDSKVREEGETAEQEFSRFATELSLHPGLYAAVRGVDVSGADPETKRMHEKTLLDFRRSGVDRDEETRGKIAALREELVLIGQEFGRTVREDVRSIETDAGELAGLPEDFLASHRPGENGKIRITTDYPDYIPVMKYARNDDVRRRLSLEYGNRGWPTNGPVLDRLLAGRHELATLLGYAHWAAYATETKMARTADAVDGFIREVAEAAREGARKEYDEVLAVRREDDPSAETLQAWQVGYYTNLLKERKYAFDPQEIRSYLEYERVLQGVLDVTGDLFGIGYVKVVGAERWHPSVRVYDVNDREDGAALGRIHLDMHPREGKYKHAAQSGLMSGLEGRQLPEGVLMCNFPDPGASDGPALMEFSDVTTLFHEFGHLLHHLLAGRRRWIRFSGVATEWDFVEVPSQLLEEWAEDPPTLQRFARHHETGEPVPAELVEKLKKAQDFGRGMQYRRQMFLAMLSLRCYNADPKDLVVDALSKELEEEYLLYPRHEGTHFYTSFGHLDGYSALYYSYAWSLVIAKDLYARFREKGMFDRETARAYRREVLEAGGSKDAADLVKAFLGRPYSTEAFREWLGK